MAGYSSQFATDVLAGLGMPATAANLQFMAAWAQAEGGSAAFNPFNTTQPASGASSYNSVGVRNYASYAQGVTATVQTLKNGNYGPILASLKAGNSAMASAQAVAATPWGTGAGVERVLGGSTGVSYTPAVTANSGAAAGTTTPSPVAAAPDENVLDSAFGFQTSELNANPELKAWAAQYMAGAFGDVSTDIGKAKAQAALYATTWYKTNSDAMRQWQHLQASDPAEANTQIAAKAADIQAAATTAGASLTPAQVTAMATSALAHAWTAQQLTNTVTSYIHYSAGTTFSGAAAATNDSLEAVAKSYGVPITQSSLGTWTQNIAQGKATADTFKELMKTQAKSLYPGIAASIDQGVTTADFVAPYLAQEQNLLELPSTGSSADFTTDPLIKQALSYKEQGAKPTDPTTVMPMYQFEQTVKNDPRWLKTDNARDAALSTAQQIGAAWGFSN